MKGRVLVFLAVLVMASALVSLSVSAEDISSSENISSDEDMPFDKGRGDLIEQVKERLDVEISRQDARKLVDAMEKLEDMGFSVEDMLEKAERLYEEYGAEFVDHMEEEVTEVVKNATANAVSSFFENLVNSVKAFFTDIFSQASGSSE